MRTEEKFTLVHNGYKVDWFDTMEEVEQEIAKRMEEHKNLNPELRVHDTGKYTNRYGEEVDCEFRHYFYYTLYSECFLIVKGWL